MEQKKDIRQLSLDQLTNELVSIGEKPFRAKQIYEWLWKKRAVSFDQMTNISEQLRKQLDDIYAIYAIKLSDSQLSTD